MASVFQLWRGLTICTEYIHPPISTRSYDWRAYVDEYEDEVNNYEEFGVTQDEAVSKLLSFLEEEGPQYDVGRISYS